MKHPIVDWPRWQKRRKAEMLAYGVPAETARVVAAAECRARQRLATLAGDGMALAAEMVFYDQPDGSTRFFLRTTAPSESPLRQGPWLVELAQW